MNSLKTILTFCMALTFTFNACKKINDHSNGPCNGKSSVIWGGDTYQLVEIGYQCWFAENLRYNANLPEVKSSSQWNSNTTGAWCYYDNISGNDTLYGKLYNWYAVNTGNLCPPGWHIPTDDEWNELIIYLGGVKEAGDKMRSTTGWTSNSNATNESGFSGLPGGTRAAFNSWASFGSFGGFGTSGHWWSSTENGVQGAWKYTLSSFNNVRKDLDHKSFGLSCRCIKD